MHKFAFVLVAVALGVIVPASRVVAQPDDASPPTYYNISSEADALLTTVTATGAPILPKGDVLEASPATAQAAIDSLGDSLGYATAPTPGQPVQDLIGAVNGLGGGNIPPVPEYPLVVQSTYPENPTESTSEGPYSISSTSTANDTTADAVLGAVTGTPTVATSQASAVADFNSTTGVLTASADASTKAFSIGPLLDIGDLTSQASMTQTPGQPTQTTSSFDVGSLTIAGVKVGLADGGLQPEGGDVLNDSLQLLDSILKASGVTITYLPSVQTPTSIDAAGLEVTYQTTLPVLGLVTVSETLGRVNVSLTAQSEPSTSDEGSGVSDTSGSSGTSDLYPSTTTGATSFQDGSTTMPVTSSATPAGGGTNSGGSQSPSAGQTTTLISPVFSSLTGHRTSEFYLVLLLLAVILLGGSRLLGVVGSRLRGTSKVAAGFNGPHVEIDDFS